MIILAAIVAAGAVFALVYTLTTSRAPTPVAARLDRFDRATASEHESRMAAPFTMRVMAPVGARMRSLAAALLPGSMLRLLEQNLLVAGNPVSLQGFLVIQVIAFACAIAVAFYTISQGPSLAGLLAGLAGAAMAAVLPIYWLRIRLMGRKRAILKALPDAVDLIVTTVEAGMSLDGALAEVGGQTRGPLGDELRLAIRETALGRGRRDALRRLIERTDVSELKTFVQSIIQAEQTGIPVGQVLRTQAKQVRLKKRQRAEAEAQRAPVKMVVVLVTMVLPSMLLMVMGPALIRMSERV
jgi:tight adherence protein C